MSFPAPSAYQCSVVIPTKNGGDLFFAAVDALRRQSCWSNVEFIVIDSGSTDNTVNVARQAGARVYTIPPEEFNHGATRDYGISLATCNSVILMVQDAVPSDGKLIERLLTALREEGVGGAYVRQIPQPTADVITKRNLDNWLTGRKEREVRFIKELGWYESLPPIEKYFFCNFDNVCSAIRKDVWEKEHFGYVNFGEDIDWAERVLKRGYKIVYEPAAAVTHSHERPLNYEYKRTYVCHRKLYRQFGLHLVPSLWKAVGAWWRATLSDLLYVVKHESAVWPMVKLASKIPAMNLFSLLGQYRAVRDEIKGVANSVRGV